MSLKKKFLKMLAEDNTQFEDIIQYRQGTDEKILTNDIEGIYYTIDTKNKKKCETYLRLDKNLNVVTGKCDNYINDESVEKSRIGWQKIFDKVKKKIEKRDFIVEVFSKED